MPKRSLHIFTDNCLRLSDNPALLNSLKDTRQLDTIFVLRGHNQSQCNVKPPVHRVKFLLESLECLKRQLGEYGIPLYIIDTPFYATLRILVSKWRVDRVTMETATSQVDVKTQSSLRIFLAAFGVSLVTEKSNCLFDTQQLKCVVKQKKFFEIISQLQPELPIPDHMVELLASFSSKTDPTLTTRVPGLKIFGISNETVARTATKLIGGEIEAKQQLHKLTGFSSNTYDHTTLCPALNFGCISPRQIYETLSKLELKPIHTEIHQNLIQRDYYKFIGCYCANVNNQGSLFSYLLPWDENAENTRRVMSGETGYPIVDAAIGQLKAGGFINSAVKSILVRMVTSEFLWLRWEIGVKLFYDWCLDYDTSICGLELMYGSNSTWLQEGIQLGDINPIESGKQIDPIGTYIKQYLPQLRQFPQEYIHTPWIASADIQKSAKCVIGEDYPRPIFPDVDKRWNLCKTRLNVFYGLISSVRRHKDINILGKRRYEEIE